MKGKISLFSFPKYIAAFSPISWDGTSIVVSGGDECQESSGCQTLLLKCPRDAVDDLHSITPNYGRRYHSCYRWMIGSLDINCKHAVLPLEIV